MWVGIGFFLETFEKSVNFFFDALKEEISYVYTLSLLEFENVKDHLVQSRAFSVVFQQKLETITTIVLGILLIL